MQISQIAGDHSTCFHRLEKSKFGSSWVEKCALDEGNQRSPRCFKPNTHQEQLGPNICPITFSRYSSMVWRRHSYFTALVSFIIS